MHKDPVNTGKTYQPQLVGRISAINSISSPVFFPFGTNFALQILIVRFPVNENLSFNRFNREQDGSS